jgi:hypothetical protein
MKEELYEEVLELLFERLGFKCQPSELEELATQIVEIAMQHEDEEPV